MSYRNFIGEYLPDGMRMIGEMLRELYARVEALEAKAKAKKKAPKKKKADPIEKVKEQLAASRPGKPRPIPTRLTHTGLKNAK